MPITVEASICPALPSHLGHQSWDESRTTKESRIQASRGTFLTTCLAEFPCRRRCSERKRKAFIVVVQQATRAIRYRSLTHKPQSPSASSRRLRLGIHQLCEGALLLRTRLLTMAPIFPFECWRRPLSLVFSRPDEFLLCDRNGTVQLYCTISQV